MLADVKLPFQPTATDCLAWSADGELAVGAGEFVHLLIPRRNHGRGRLHPFDLDPWIQVSFRINSFTVDEWPTQPLSDLDNFSIGEEQSLGTVVALSWSTIPLAKHKRFALAILTSNHVLSLWASASDPKVAASWERVLVINKAIEVFAEANIFPNAFDEASRDRLRQMMRIRAISWAPDASTNTSNTEDASSNLGAELVVRVPHLAVTDDAGNVAVVQIESPWSDRRSPDWEARTVFHVNWDRLRKPPGDQVKDEFTMEENPAPTPTAEQPIWPSLFATCLSKKNFIQSVMCVPCRSHEQGFGLVLHKDPQVLHLDIPYHLPNSQSHVAFADAGNISLLSWKTSQAQVTSFGQELPLIDEWDEISGLAFTPSTGDTDPSLHVSGLLSGCSTCLVQWNAPTNYQNGNRITEPVRSALYDQTLVLQRDFDQHHDLGGLAFSRTWGLASWGSYVAACITFHPGDMVEYIMPSSERCHIVFMKEDADDDLQENANFPWQEISATNVERSTHIVLQEILTMTDGQAAAQTALDQRILYNICCARSAAEDNQESLNEYVVVNTVPETMDVDETGDENMMGGELDTLEDTGFADTLFAAFDVCPYCQIFAGKKTSTVSSKSSSMTSSLATTIEGDRRISLGRVQPTSPKIVQRPTSPAISLKANLSFANLMASSNNTSSRKQSVATSPGSTDHANKTLDRLDQPSSADEGDPDEEIAADTLTDFLNYPNDSHTAVKSPGHRHHFRSGSVSVPVASGAASFVTSSSAQPDASVRDMRSPRGSVSTGGSYMIPSIIDPPDNRKPSVGSAVSKSSPDGFPASEAVATPDETGDSPTLGYILDQFPMPPTTKPKKGKARDSMILRRNSHTSDDEPKARKDSTPTIKTQNTETEAEKRLHLPFLPKFLRLAGSPRNSVNAATDQGRDSMEITEVDEIVPKPQDENALKSTFEADSSDDEDGDPYDRKPFVGGAKLASLRQSQAKGAKNTSVRSQSSKKVVSLHEILKASGIEGVADHLQHTGTSLLADVNPGPSTLKAKRLLGESSIKMKRAGIVGMPAVQEGGGVQAALEDSNQPVIEKPRSRQLGLFDGLRSNPVKRAATTPTGSGKKITLPPLEIGAEQRKVRNSIVSTPYPPFGFKFRKSGDDDDIARSGGGGHGLDHHKGEAAILLVLYRRNRTTPIIRKTILPNPTTTTTTNPNDNNNDDEKGLPFHTTTTAPYFDDEQLFRLLKSQYRRMRGHLLSVRRVQSIGLLSYTRLSQLAAPAPSISPSPHNSRHNNNNNARRKTFRVYDDVFTEQRLMDLWNAPDRGRGRREWVEWIASLPPHHHHHSSSSPPPPPHPLHSPSAHHHHNQQHQQQQYHPRGSNNSKQDPNHDQHEHQHENVALELLEGWHLPLIASAICLTLILSLLTTLLWIFLGVDGAVALRNEARVGMGVGLEMGRSGFRGAGDRVGTGVGMGVLVLMVGWTGVGGWVLVGWLGL
ncbi:hypothetical protein Q9189_001227 [Teloschistes chrysophthalmus]